MTESGHMRMQDGSKRRARRRGAAAALLACATVSPASAALFCVDSEASAQAALDVARTNGQADYIMFESGAYPLIAGLQYSATADSDHGALILSGGFDTGCSARTGATLLDGQAQAQPLRLSLWDADVVIVDHLTLFRGMTEPGSNFGGNMQVYIYGQGDGARLVIDSVRFLNGHANGNSGGLYVSGHGEVVVSNSLFSGNTAPQTPAGSIDFDGPLHFTNNTVTGNIAQAAEPRPIFYVHAHGSSHFWLSNSILWGNDNASDDLYLYPEGTYDLVSNDIGSYSNVPLGAVSGGNVSVDPQFADCGFLCFDKPLVRASLLVDAGNDTPPGGLTAADLPGLPRVIGPHVDMGAYELDRLFADGFQSSIFD